jgi:hypothetical protein
VDWDLVLIVVEIALAAALLVMFQAARRALSVEDARRAATEESERLAASVETLTSRIEEAVDRALYDLERRIERAEEIAARLEAAADAARPFVVAEPDPAAARGASRIADKRSRVMELAEAGRDPAAIAKEVGIGVGEVELMLGLSEKARTSPQGKLFAKPGGESSE